MEFTFAIFCGIWCWVAAASTGCHSQYSEWLNLQSIFDYMNGESWVWKPSNYGSKWNFTNYEVNNPCSEKWQGVNCTSISANQCSVTSITLTEYNISGQFPSMKNLSSLQSIDFSFNFISGDLPLDLFSFDYLEIIKLQVNLLSGTVPNVFQLPSLREIDISYNRLHGTIPWKMMCLHSGLSLTNVQLAFNRLQGNFNDGNSSIINCHALQTLNLNHNALTGPLSREWFTHVEPSLLHLHMNKNNLTGSLSALNFSFVQLQSIDLSNNSFVGDLPLNLFQSDQLQEISFSYNNLMGNLPLILEKATSPLIYLSLDNNPQLHGTFSSTIWPLEMQSTLRGISLSTTMISTNLNAFVPLLNLELINLKHANVSGTLPPELCQLRYLREFAIGKNNVTGSIPKQYFPYPNNGIEGNVSCFPSLSIFSIERNKISGTLPTNMSSMIALKTFRISSNLFEGSVPSIWPENIQRIVLHSNAFYGEVIVSSFEQLPSLLQLSLSNNYLTGSWLPSNYLETQGINNITWASALTLRYFQIQRNHFHGLIFPLVRQFENLIDLSVAHNSFSGEILLPNISSESWFLGKYPWHRMVVFYASKNYFHGPVSNILDINKDFGIVGNASLYSSLLELSASFNFFTGTLPTIYIDDDNTSAYLRSNSNVGSSSVRLYLPNISIFRCYLNLLTGRIDSLFQVSTIEDFSLDSNLLSGTLPSIYFNPSINIFSLYQNIFTGILPASLSQQASLQVLLVNNNFLSGNLAIFFDANKMAPVYPYLDTLDISENFLSGSIPWLLLKERMSKLRIISASSNCISSPITSDICSNSSNVEELVLDGIRSAKTCRQNLFSFSNSFYLKAPTPAGTIPSCLFALPQLQLLHLAGNMMYGKLPSDAQVAKGEVIVSSKLTALVLGDNVLTGTIPLWIQRKRWEVLVLSNNRLTGVISDEFNAQTALLGTVRAEVNRLSGYIPTVLNEANNIQILNGNLFNCHVVDAGRTDLPTKDPVVDSYTCGSSPTNNAIFAWGIIFGGFLFLVLVIYIVLRCNSPFKSSSSNVISLDVYSSTSWFVKTFSLIWQHWIEWCVPVDNDFQFVKCIFVGVFADEAVKSQDYDNRVTSNKTRVNCTRNSDFQSTLTWPEVVSYCRVFAIMRRYFVILSFFLLLFLIPVFIALSNIYGVHYFEYIWTVSGLFLTGTTPAIVLLTLFLIIVAFNWIRVISARRSTSPCFQSKCLPSSWYILYIAINILANISIDVAYVVAVIRASDLRTSLLAFTQAIAKMVWNTLFTERFFLWMKWNQAMSSGSTDSTKGSNNNPHSSESMKNPLPTYIYDTCLTKQQLLNDFDCVIVTVLMMLNTLWIPSLVVLIVSPNCLFNAWVPPSPYDGVYVSYDQDQIVASDDFDLASLSTIYHTVTYEAPFVYPYMCASTVVTFFAPAFISQAILRTIVVPLLHIITYRLYSFLHNKYLDQVNIGTEVGQQYWMCKYLFNVLPNHFKLLVALRHKDALMQFMNSYFTKDHDKSIKSVRSLSQCIRYVVSNVSYFFSLPTFFVTDRLVTVKILNIMAIVLCFGSMFPLLCLPVSIVAVGTTWTEEKLIHQVWTWSRLQLTHHHTDDDVEDKHAVTVENPLQTNNTANITVQTGTIAHGKEDKEEKRISKVKDTLAQFIIRNLEVELPVYQYYFSHSGLLLCVLAVICPILSFLIFDTAGDSDGYTTGLALALPLLSAPLVLFVLEQFVIPAWGPFPNTLGKGTTRNASVELPITTFREQTTSDVNNEIDN